MGGVVWWRHALCAGQLLLGRRRRALRAAHRHLATDPQRGGAAGAAAGRARQAAADQPWHHYKDTWRYVYMSNKTGMVTEEDMS